MHPEPTTQTEREEMEAQAEAALAGMRARLEAVAAVPLASVSPSQLQALAGAAQCLHTILDGAAWPQGRAES